MKKTIFLFASFLLIFGYFDQFIQAKDEPIEHSIRVGDGDNMCMRPVEGDFSFDIKEDKRPVDLVIIQDASGSFKDNIASVKSAVTQSVQKMDPEDRVMLTSYQGGNQVKYNNGNTAIVGGTPVSTKTLQNLSRNKDLTTAYNNLVLAGGTPTATGLQYAIDQYKSIRSNESEDRKTVFLLITDGVANVQLDGYVHKLNNQTSDYTTGDSYSLEYNQDYKGALSQVQNLMQTINSSDYEMSVGFWESINQLSSPTQYYDKYQSQVSPYIKNGLANSASSEGHFIAENDINNFAKRLSGLIANSILSVPKTQVELNINKNFDLKEFNITTDTGENIQYQKVGNKVTFDLKAGSNIRNVKVNYKLNEQEKVTENNTVVTSGFVQFGNDRQLLKEGMINANTLNCDPSTEEPSTEEPSTEEPSTEEPSTEEPSTEEPSTEEPSTEEPSTEEPSTEEPSTEEPSTEEPSTEEPSTEEPSTEEPSTEEPSTEEPNTEEPSTEEPSTEEPSTEEPSTEEPSTEEPSTEEPSTEEPSTEEPSTEEPSTEEPSTEEPSTEEPSTEEPSTEEPSTEEPSTEEPSTEEPSTEEPSTEEPSTEEPSTEEPSTEEPSTEEPSTEEPSTEEPSTEEPSTEEPSTEEPSTEEPSTEEPSTNSSIEKPNTDPSAKEPSSPAEGNQLKPNDDSSSTDKDKHSNSQTQNNDKNNFLPNTGEAIKSHPVISTFIGILLLVIGIGLFAFRRKQ
ncbi:VWA domain-containing protein [Mammaliicoccus fleurettii]|uniref:VWA domain-containing protein n=1 Tax=Mammaliicoccus fleurettii TaxID=150056 RepID=UPI0018E9F588|nr:VWA domain-containing protein [Mammaliicoccus fleurettii]